MFSLHQTFQIQVNITYKNLQPFALIFLILFILLIQQQIF